MWLADLLARHLRAADVPAEVQPLAPGRANLLARLPGSGERPALALSGTWRPLPRFGLEASAQHLAKIRACKDNEYGGPMLRGRLDRPHV